MRLFLDQGVPRRSAELMRDLGIDTVHASEVGLSAADDELILVWCREHDRVAVTLDTDFHARLAVGGHDRPSVIRIRQEAPHSRLGRCSPYGMDAFERAGFRWPADRTAGVAEFLWRESGPI